LFGRDTLGSSLLINHHFEDPDEVMRIILKYTEDYRKIFVLWVGLNWIRIRLYALFCIRDIKIVT
jgi:hypothetical protein